MKEVPEKKLWVFSHHYGLQTQRYRHIPKVVVNIEDVTGGEKEEMLGKVAVKLGSYKKVQKRE